MSRIPDYAHNLSLRMSRILNRIGVNEKMVMKKRRSILMKESIETLTFGSNLNMLYVGSQMECTTTTGLQPDTDILFSYGKIYNVIQDLDEFEYGKINMLMVQDEYVSPGYCFLQVLIDDIQPPHLVKINEHSYKDGMGKIFLKNSMINDIGWNHMVRHGPAFSEEDDPTVDYVPAFPCQSSPVQARPWLNQDRVEHWPTNNMIQYCRNTGCFVVGVGKKGSVNEILEWRISTSFSERCLMFNLNITQIRCYVLMKMILKTFITQRCPDSISSFMCKTVLLHCISYTTFDAWTKNKLFTCLSFCLSTLYNCVQNEYCSHFIITQNNLMSGQFTLETKRLILEALRHVIESNGRALLEIECDHFGAFLQASCLGIGCVSPLPTYQARILLRDTHFNICAGVKNILRETYDLSPRLTMQKLLTFMSNHQNENSTSIHRKAYRLITRRVCSLIGSVIASSDINQQDHLTYKKALSFMSLGLDSDVASGKLKLASFFYCIGDIARTEMVLKNVEERYDLSVVEPMCFCYNFKHALRQNKRFNSICYGLNDDYLLLKQITASCVYFLRCEINCCPFELQYEMFRSTQEDFAYRGEKDKWMDMAVVDSLPYLYFLQYKTYSRLGRQDDKQRALLSIERAIDVGLNLGHSETALNLLGQCMEEENNLENAFKCYARSLHIRRKNNSAKVHICKLLNTLINY